MYIYVSLYTHAYTHMEAVRIGINPCVWKMRLRSHWMRELSVMS